MEAARVAGGSPAASQRYVTLLFVLMPLARIGVSVGVFAFGPLGLLIQRDLGLSRGELGGLLMALQAGALATTLLAARLADRLGVRGVFPASQALVGLGLVLLAAADGVLTALSAAFVTGLGHGVMTPSLSKAALDWAPRERRGLLVGLLQFAGPIAAIGASIALPPLGLATDWRTALRTVGALAAGSALVFALLYRDLSTKRPASDAPRSAWWRAFADRDALLLGAATALCGAAGQALYAFLILFLFERHAWTLPAAGLALAQAQAAGSVTLLALGVLSDRVLAARRRPPLLATCCAGLIGATLLAAAAPGTAPLVLLAAVVLAGAGALGYLGVMIIFAGERARPEDVASAVGFNLSIGYAGFIGGAPAFGWLADTAGYSAAWLATSAAFLVATACVAAVHEPPGQPHH